MKLSKKKLKKSIPCSNLYWKKGLPPFWDPENKSLSKKDYNELLVQRVNYHSKFDDLEGSLKGETIVVKLGDLF